MRITHIDVYPLTVPIIQHESEPGNILYVERLCLAMDKDGMTGVIAAWKGEDIVSYIVPAPLVPWIRDIILVFPHNGFPCYIDFGILRGHYYAEFLLNNPHGSRKGYKQEGE